MITAFGWVLLTLYAISVGIMVRLAIYDINRRLSLYMVVYSVFLMVCIVLFGTGTGVL